MIPSSVRRVLDKHGSGKVTFLTGAGVSAESGIPTFRGADGFWTVGSENYRPEELATREFWIREPRALWGWYLMRRLACLAAQPNSAHDAIAKFQRDRRDAEVITQNVDGLHKRAQSDERRRGDIIEVHGSLSYGRCEHCGALVDLTSLPLGRDTSRIHEGIVDDVEWQSLKCDPAKHPRLVLNHKVVPRLRPHVLWFDESYTSSPHYRWDTVQDVAATTDLLIVIGTSGAAMAPFMVFDEVSRSGKGIVVLNKDASDFTSYADGAQALGRLQASWLGHASELVPAVCAYLLKGDAEASLF